MKTRGMFHVIILSILAAGSPAMAQSRIVLAPSTKGDVRKEHRASSERGGSPLHAQVRAARRVKGAGDDALTAEPAMPARHLFADLDGDGLKDLFVLDAKGNLLFRNLGNGLFEDRTAAAFPDGAGFGITAFFGDCNGDGREDLFLFQEKGFTLFWNDGGFRFRDVTEAMGMDKHLAAESARMEDYDGDGINDLLVRTPEGDRIYRNRGGLGFDVVDLTGPRGNTRGSGTTSPVASPGGPASGGPNSMGGGTFDTLFINDNSPGSVGMGVPEVEGGDDVLTQNDIVDGTVTGADIQDASITGTDVQNASLTGADMKDGTLTGVDMKNDSIAPSKVTGIAATLTGNQTFDYGTLFIDAANHRVGMGTTAPYAKLDVMTNGDYGVYGLTNKTSGNGYGVFGGSTAPAGSGVYGYGLFGVHGESDRVDGVGVFGMNGLSSGTGVYGSGGFEGVRGYSAANDGVGVTGWVNASTGNTCGVYGVSLSDNGFGVLGYAMSGDGATSGVYGYSASNNGMGIRGEAQAMMGITYGVHGTSASNQGIGARGVATSATGYTRGVYGETLSTQGYGVLGVASAGSGTTSGVFGKSVSPDGHGVFGYGTQGVAGLSPSTAGSGVYGEATAATGYTRGVFGWCDSSEGSGVHGYASSKSTNLLSYGVSGRCDSPTGAGVFGYADSSTGFNEGVWGYTQSSSGYGVFSTGDMGCTGLKPFVQPHPTDASKEIRFVCLEGNESGTYFRGASKLEGGTACIEVPEDFRLVSEPEGVTVQITPLGPAKVWIEEYGLDRIIVRGDTDVAFHYFVNGVRRGFAEFETVRRNRAWVPMVRGVPFGTQYPHALRRILVENGTLNPDFTPNEETAKRMGWKLLGPEDDHPLAAAAKPSKLAFSVRDQVEGTEAAGHGWINDSPRRRGMALDRVKEGNARSARHQEALERQITRPALIQKLREEKARTSAKAKGTRKEGIDTSILEK